MKLFDTIKKSSGVLKENRFRIYKIIGVLAAVVFYLYFLLNQTLYTLTEGDVAYYYKKRILLITVIMAIIIAFIFIKNNLSDRINKIFAAMLTFVSPVTAFFLIEYISGGVISQMKIEYIVLNLLILYVLLLVLLAITNSLAIAPVMLILISVVFSIASYFVNEFRDAPIMASDIATITTAADVSGEYTYTLTYAAYFSLLILFMYIVLVCKLKNTKIFKWKFRIVFAILTAVISVVFVNQIVLSDRLEEMNIRISMFRPMRSYQTVGTALGFVRTIRYTIVDKPEGYSVDAVNEIIEKYTLNIETEDIVGESDIKPNIITIIDETFSSLEVLGDFTTSEDYIPFFNSLQENTIRGYTYASVIGGMTANTEFEFLTNNSMAFLPTQSVAFQLYVNKVMPSITTSLKTLGYIGNDAMHPHTKNNYNRPKVYANLGFDYFISNEDFTDEVIQEGKLRKWLSDRTSFQRVIEEYESSRSESDAPFFIYNMTVQNHSPYDRDFNNFEQKITIDSEYYAADANRYINLLKYSDDAFRELVNYFESIDEPTIILFFGDHQPKLGSTFFNLITGNQMKYWNDEQMMSRYMVPYVIWANYDIEEQTIDTSINYLQTQLFIAAGCELTGYQKFLKDLMQDIPVINAIGYFGADGNYYELGDKTSPYYDRIQEYRILQYNNVIDTKNRIDSFFNLE